MDQSGGVSKQDEDGDISEAKIEDIVSNRMAHCRNSILVSQVKKVLLSDTVSLEKRNSLHNVLQQLSDKSLHSTEQQYVIKIPRKSAYDAQITIQEYVISGEKGKLLSDSFVQKLPVSIAEKRLYRKSISVSFKRKPWHTELHNFLQRKWENLSSHFDLWEESLNLIEGLHGVSVVSYFVFIRWLLYMNLIIFLFNFIFLVTPQIIIPDSEVISVNDTNFTHALSVVDNNLVKIYEADAELLIDFSSRNSVETTVAYCQQLYAQDISNDSRSGFIAAVQGFLQGTGPLEPTHLFMGFYPPYNTYDHGHQHVYYTSVAFLCTLLASLLVSFFMMIDYSSIGVQEETTITSKKSNFYTNEVLCAWDYSIREPETANHFHSQLVFELKTALEEDRSAKKVTERSSRMWMDLYSIRFFINLSSLLWLIGCCYLIYFVTVYQMREQQKHALSEPGFRTLFLQFLPSLTLIILNSVSSIVFSRLVTFEKYSARFASNVTIVRNLVLYLSSIIVLLNTFHYQVACKAKDLCGAGLDSTCRSPRCWETYIGQQLYKLTITKLFVDMGVLGNDSLKYYICKKYDNKCTRLLGFPAFSLPSEVLGAINAQTILWLGVFYSPLLPAVMIFKFLVLFYIRKIKVVKLCPPQESSYRASKFNSVFIFIMLISFFVVLVVQGFAIDSIPPSRGCGPFRYFERMTEAIPEIIRNWLSILMSYWFFTLVIVILCITYYYYRGIRSSQKELLKGLRAHLVLQSYDKQFLLKAIAEMKNRQEGNKS